ncbi:amidase [Fervidibacillus halotolerans]|uniref:Amidase n=1 Tax=Fervidibacillus halotolerans TaxID=2980027 RepID=A0A9E8M066_9BACI|nr:amidase [Fervidibacillus halotolerans]WAA12515.1 amidase [Fervidibacillus halotolerans]
MKKNEYIQLDAVEISTLIKRKEVHAKEIVMAAIERLEEVNPTINAVVHERIERALQELDSLDAKTPFYGVPLLLKNISQNVKGEPITSGSRLLKNHIADHDAHFVKTLRDAGFSILGHTNTPEFGLKNITEPEIYGPTRNPWNTNYSPGGSSGGSAASVAAGIVPVAGASDGGGSIRIPASFTGLFGLKPTRGRTPVGPGYGRAWQGAAINFVLSRSVRDSAALLELLQTVQPEAAFQTPLFTEGYVNVLNKPLKKTLRIAYSTKSPVDTPVSDEAKKAVEKIVKWLDRQGHIIEERELPIDGIQLMKDYYIMNSGEMNATARSLEKAFGRVLTENDMEIESWVLHVAGKSLSAAEYAESLASWDLAAEKMANFHRHFDFFITPATAFPAPKVGELTHSKDAQLELQKNIANASKEEQQQIIYDMFLPSLTYTPFTQLANLTGQPAMSVPIHVTADGLPIGVQVMTQKGEEHRLLQLAAQVEQTDLWIGMKGNPMFKD